MAKNPTDRKYTRTHEWARKNPASPKGGTGQAMIEVGITDFAQQQLSDITYVELPAIGTSFAAGKEMAVVESIKAAADVYAPVSGTIAEINSTLTENPGVINSDPFGKGWLVRIKADNPKEIEGLMSAAEYEAFSGKE
jgi:glycine cleavage system H protein